MIILKYVGHKIKNSSELENLLNHLKETTAQVEGVSLKDIYFPKGKGEFVLAKSGRVRRVVGSEKSSRVRSLLLLFHRSHAHSGQY